MLHPDTLERWHERWADLNPWLRFVVVLGVLGLIGWLVGTPLYRQFREWRLEKNLVTAVEVAEKSDGKEEMEEARDLALTVLRAGDPRIEVFRVLEKALGRLDDPLHGEVSRALLTHPDSSEEDRLKGFRGVAPVLPLGVVGQAWNEVPEESQKKPEFAEVFGRRLIAAGRLPEAATVLLAVPEELRTAEIERHLIRVLVLSRKKQGYEEAQRRIALRWSTAPPGEDAAWLSVFEELPLQALQPGLLGAVRKRLGDAESLEPAQRALATARIDYAANPSGRAALIEEAIDRWQGSAPVEVARFLSVVGVYRRILDEFPPASVSGCPGLLPYVLKALEESEQWSEVKPLVQPLLEVKGLPLPEYEMLGRMAVAAARLRNDPEKVEYWAAAIAEAKFSQEPDALLKLAKLGELSGLGPESMEALLEAVTRGRGPLPLYAEIQPLLQWLLTEGRESNLMQVCGNYLLYEPGNPELLTRYAYLASLTGLVAPEKILESFKPMAEAFPDLKETQCVLATAYLSSGDADTAAGVFRTTEADWASMWLGYRAAFVAARVLSREIDFDDPEVTQFPVQQLLPSERRRFSEWLLKAGG